MRVRNYKAILYRFLNPQRRKPNKKQRKGTPSHLLHTQGGIGKGVKKPDEGD